MVALSKRAKLPEIVEGLNAKRFWDPRLDLLGLDSATPELTWSLGVASWGRFERMGVTNWRWMEWEGWGDGEDVQTLHNQRCIAAYQLFSQGIDMGTGKVVALETPV